MDFFGDRKRSDENQSSVSGQSRERIGLLNDLASIADTLIRKFLGDSKEKISFDEYISNLSEKIDKLILNGQRERNQQCAGGTLTFKMSPNKTQLFGELELFFFDANKKWMKEEGKFTIKTSFFTPESLDKRFKEMSLILDVDPPDMN